MDILTVENIGKTYGGVKALDHVSFGLAEGCVTALIGPNGAGKTTLFNIITGLIGSDHGRVHLRGIEITGAAPHRVAQCGVTRTFQEPRLFSQMSVLENVLVGASDAKAEGVFRALADGRWARKGEDENKETGLKLLKGVGLSEKAMDLAETLSYGQRKLLELVRAMATGPEVLLLDEPTAGLFPVVASKVHDIILALHGSGKTVMFITHDMQLMAELADKVIVLECGLLFNGSPSEVRGNRNVIDAFLGKGRTNAT
jgi:branched-chain amino acid transport system ATP-binding protein